MKKEKLYFILRVVNKTGSTLITGATPPSQNTSNVTTFNQNEIWKQYPDSLLAFTIHI